MFHPWVLDIVWQYLLGLGQETSLGSTIPVNSLIMWHSIGSHILPYLPSCDVRRVHRPLDASALVFVLLFGRSSHIVWFSCCWAYNIYQVDQVRCRSTMLGFPCECNNSWIPRENLFWIGYVYSCIAIYPIWPYLVCWWWLGLKYDRLFTPLWEKKWPTMLQIWKPTSIYMNILSISETNLW